MSYSARCHWQAGGLQLALLCLALPALCTQVPRQPTHPSVPMAPPCPCPVPTLTRYQGTAARATWCSGWGLARVP